MLLEEPFVSGRLLLENTPSGNAPVVAESVPVLFTVLAVAFVLASFLFLPRLVSLAPLLFDSLFRARGSVSLENSVRYSNDRRLLATILLLPSSLLIYRYRLWDADFVQGMSEGWRLVVIIGVFAVFFLFRLFMYALCKPRRQLDFYRLSGDLGFVTATYSAMSAACTQTLGIYAEWGKDQAGNNFRVASENKIPKSDYMSPKSLHNHSWNYLFCDGHVAMMHPGATIRQGHETIYDAPDHNMWTIDPTDDK